MIQYYIQDVAAELRRNAFDVRNQIAASTGVDREFLTGKLLAYNEVLSLLISQARSFEIDPKLLGLTDLDPDRDF